MNVGKFLKEKRLGLSVLFIFFVLLILSLASHIIFHEIYQISIFFFIIIFIFSQYFDFEYRLFIGFALFLLIICIFLLIFKLDTLAGSFTNYVYGFLVLGIAGYFFDNLREKLKSKGTIKIYKKVFLSILVIFLLSSVFIFVRDYRNNSDYTVVIKENIVKLPAIVKNKYLRTFKKDIYYSGLDTVEVDGKKISRDIIINIDSPKADSIISKTIDLSGWAIESNSIDNTGIDKIEFFLDGKPGKGKYLGDFSVPYYRSDIETLKVLENLYLQFYDRKPSENELNLWTTILEYRLLSFYDVILSITNSSGIVNRNLSNEDYIKVLYLGLFNRKADEGGLKNWTDLLNKGSVDRYGVLKKFLDSNEFKIKSDSYYSSVPLKKGMLDIMRKDVGEKYRAQFYLSGFDVYLDSTNVENGKHAIYVYAHSPVFGWDYKEVDFFIEN